MRFFTPNIANMQNILRMNVCRDNPFKDINGIDGKQINDGLAPIRAPVGKCGIGWRGFTSHLLEHMNDKITIEEVFQTVSKGGAKQLNDSQITWEHSALYDDVYIN
ncbi:MAG: hypothetical protein ACI9PZ_003019 [Parvicella sp.]|jgi:hypothetical protein